MELAISTATFNNFENYLKAHNKSNFKQILCYAQKYTDVLLTQNASILVSLSSAAQRWHAREALPASKIAGCYNVWKDICNKYQLRWSNSDKDNLRYFTNYLYDHGNFDQMMTWLNDASKKLPRQTRSVLFFDALTGLRPSAGVLSVELIKIDPAYTNKETMMLKHFRYIEKFIRKKPDSI
jgi:hypothetical protein